jgi:two-component system NtrC family sensor kinase
MQYTIFLILSPIVIIASTAASFFTVRQRGAKGALALSLYLWASAVFIIINTLELIARTESQKLLFARSNYIFISAIPVLFFIFALTYSGREETISRKILISLFVIPFITVMAVFTNQYHHLIWKDIEFSIAMGLLTLRVTYGTWFWVHAVYSYMLIVISVFLLCKISFRNFSLYRKRQDLIIIGALLPLILNIIYSLKLIPGFTKNYTPIGFGIAGVLFTVNTLKFHLFDIKPIARQILIERMRDGMLVIDENHRIVDMNLCAGDLLGNKDMIGKSVNEIPFLADIDFTLSSGESWKRGIKGPRAGIYNICVTPLGGGEGKKNGLRGTLVTVYDVTAMHELITEKNHLIEELQKALSEIKALQGILPICVNCKRVRDDDGYWHQVDMYLSEHSSVQFSHGLCPSCYKKLYPGE